jgi:hypothetical protein
MDKGRKFFTYDCIIYLSMWLLVRRLEAQLLALLINMASTNKFIKVSETS